LFSLRNIETLRTAVAELSWLLERGYGDTSALELVGNRHGLRRRQRIAVRRSACPESARRRRVAHRVDEAAGRGLAVDGFNCLITLEAALAGGVLLRGRDGALRDLASVHGSYRRVETTERAIAAIGARLLQLNVSGVTWYLDRPVSNSGRLRDMLLASAPLGLPWTVELAFDPDRVLRATDAVVATSDASVLDDATAWMNLAGDIVERDLPDAWVVDLGLSPALAPPLERQKTA
jgi:hypothetical protein